MKKILIFYFFAICFLNGYAHNPLSAMYYLEVEDDFGILNISLSQAGLNEAMSKAYSEKVLGKLSTVEHKKLIVKYIKDNFFLKINGNKISLLDGGVKLGNHQTDLKFLTSNLPKQFNTLETKIEAFKENKHHQTVLSVKLNDKTSKVILNEDDNYSATVNFVDNEMIVDSNKFKKSYLWFLVVIPVFILVRKVIQNQK